MSFPFCEMLRPGDLPHCRGVQVLDQALVVPDRRLLGCLRVVIILRVLMVLEYLLPAILKILKLPEQLITVFGHLLC